jgi:hypothetical protein
MSCVTSTGTGARLPRKAKPKHGQSFDPEPRSVSVCDSDDPDRGSGPAMTRSWESCNAKQLDRRWPQWGQNEPSKHVRSDGSFRRKRSWAGPFPRSREPYPSKVRQAAPRRAEGRLAVSMRFRERPLLDSPAFAAHQRGRYGEGHDELAAPRVPGHRLPFVALMPQWRQDCPNNRPPTWTTGISAMGNGPDRPLQPSVLARVWPVSTKPRPRLYTPARISDSWSIRTIIRMTDVSMSANAQSSGSPALRNPSIRCSASFGFL